MPPGPQFKRPCLTCNTLTYGSYCDQHKPIRKRSDNPGRKEKKRFLYGGDYYKRAKAIRATGGLCHLCHTPVPPGEGEADHIYPELGWRSPLAIAHRICNQRRGNKPVIADIVPPISG